MGSHHIETVKEVRDALNSGDYKNVYVTFSLNGQRCPVATTKAEVEQYLEGEDDDAHIDGELGFNSITLHS